MRRRAFLMYPPTGVFDRSDRCQTPIDLTASQAARPPLDLALMASSLQRAGLSCFCRDYPLEGGGWSRYISDMMSLTPDFVIVSLTSFSYHEDMKAVKIARALLPNVVTIVKGAHFGKLHREIMSEYPELDVGIRGDCESAVAEIATSDWHTVSGITFRDSQGVIHETAERPAMLDLDRLAFPARSLTAWQLYQLPGRNEPYTTILAARGCPFSCIYCLVESVTGTRIASRSPDSLVEEIRECVTRFGIRHFLLKADTFTLQRSWVCEFCTALIDSGLDVLWFTNTRPDTIDSELATLMRRAGCWMLAMGVESGNQEILDKIGKKTTLPGIRHGVEACQNAGIQTFLYFTIGLPWDTVATIRQTLAFSRELNGDYVEYHPIFPFPGTPIHELGVKEGLFEPISDFSHDIRPVNFCRSRTVSIGWINALRIWGLFRFYGRPRILRRLLHRHGASYVWKLVFFGLWKIGQSTFRTAIKPLFVTNPHGKTKDGSEARQ